MALFALTLVTLLVLVGIFLPNSLQKSKRQRLMQQAFPSAWRQILKRRMPYFRALPTDLQLQLKKLILVFVDEKQFIGCDGLEVTDEMRVTIAAQACLLLLNKPAHFYPNLKRILIYPSAFIVQHQEQDAAGVVSHSQSVRLGESWQSGQLVLSWQDTLQSAAICDDGHNLVIHEFAHQLDQLKGAATGVPPLRNEKAYQRWADVFSREFELLQTQLHRGEPTLLDPYAATNPAEFFAVVTEFFFEQPKQLHEQHPALYQLLSQYYALDPLSW